MSRKDEIDQIRREKFWLEPDGSARKIRDEQGKIIAQNSLARDLHQAIKNLSRDLYTKDVHFVLELIQNAEDNSYAKNVTPELKFKSMLDDPSSSSDDGALWLVNNEKGFQLENIRALCGVGDSTKTKRDGYIGEKGIGFKSVFKISPKPYIFSNGYQIFFQESPDPVAGFGYIVPSWVSKISNRLLEFKECTQILLPLKSEKYDEVKKYLQEIAPETILFLDKIKTLEIDVDGATSSAVKRDDKESPLIRLSSQKGISNWWVISRPYDVPNTLHEEKRRDVKTRHVTVAFNLNDDKDANYSVFAFLPTEVRSGFPFLINADFILTSTRESIDVDLPWNKWLRDQVAETFLDGFEDLLKQIKYRLEAYRFIPLADKTHDSFFKPVGDSVLEGLRTRRVVWTTKNDKELFAPQETRFAIKEFRALLDDTLPTQLRQTPLIHPEIEKYKERLRLIGVQELSEDELVACLRDKEWLQSHNAAWFFKLYQYLSKRSWATKERLQDCALVLLDNGEIVNPGGMPLYFSADEALELMKLQRRWHEFVYIGFLDRELYKLVDSDHDLRDWLQKILEVYPLSPENFCIDLISAARRHRDVMGGDMLIAMTSFIRDHLGPDQLSYAKSNLPLLTNRGIISPIAWNDQQPLVTPAEMNLDTGWQLIFISDSDKQHLTILSDQYLTKCTYREKEKWGKFFEQLGATDAPKPYKRVWQWQSSYHRPQDLRPNAQKVNGGSPPYELHDYMAFEWFSSCQTLSSDERHLRCKALLVWLKKLWESQSPFLLPEQFSGSYFFSTGFGHRSYRQSQNFSSDFKMQLLNSPWLVTTKGFRAPTDNVFLDKPEISEYFGDAVAYTGEFKDEKLVGWLEIHTSATAKGLLSWLKQIALSPAEQVDRGLILKIYHFIDPRWSSEFFSEFENQKLILVHQPTPQWVSRQSVIWPNLADVFGETFTYLSSQYQAADGLHDFFVDKLKVKENLMHRSIKMPGCICRMAINLLKK